MNEVSSSPLAVLGERYSSQTGVDDPASCGENLDLNLKLISEIAPSLCTDCGGYHLRYAVSRVSMPMTPINFDRMELAQIVGAKVRAAGENGRVDVTIGGAADTGILATCAHGVAAAGADASRVHYAVLDICEAPLALCKAFARRHDLDIETAVVDLRKPASRLPSDIILLHSVLRQISAEFHTPILKEMAGWLKPEGCIVFSNRIRGPHRVTKEHRLELLAERARRGDVTLPVSIDQIAKTYDERPSQPHEFETLEEIRALFDRSGLTLESDLLLEKEKVIGGRAAAETRYIAVLKR
jgi:hypothetical protein